MKTPSLSGLPVAIPAASAAGRVAASHGPGSLSFELALIDAARLAASFPAATAAARVAVPVLALPLQAPACTDVAVRLPPLTLAQAHRTASGVAGVKPRPPVILAASPDRTSTASSNRNPTATPPDPSPVHPERCASAHAEARSRRAPTPTTTPNAPDPSPVHPERSASAHAEARSRRAPTATATTAPRRGVPELEVHSAHDAGEVTPDEVASERTTLPYAYPGAIPLPATVEEGPDAVGPWKPTAIASPASTPTPTDPSAVHPEPFDGLSAGSAPADAQARGRTAATTSASRPQRGASPPSPPRSEPPTPIAPPQGRAASRSASTPTTASRPTPPLAIPNAAPAAIAPEAPPEPAPGAADAPQAPSRPAPPRPERRTVAAAPIELVASALPASAPPTKAAAASAPARPDARAPLGRVAITPRSVTRANQAAAALDAAPRRNEAGTTHGRSEKDARAPASSASPPTPAPTSTPAPAPASTATPAPAASGTSPAQTVALPASVERALDQASGAVLAAGAHLRLDGGPAGELELHLRVRGGVAHVRVEGEAAPALAARDTELSRALSAEGLVLGRLEVEPRAATTSAPAPSTAGGDAGSGGTSGSGSHASGGGTHERPEPGREAPVHREPPRRGRPAARTGLDVEA